MTSASLPNPWAQLPSFAPYVVPDDEPHVTAFNSGYTVGWPYYIDLSMPPEPVIGLHGAPVVLLSANPGNSADDLPSYLKQGATQEALKDAAAAGGVPVRWLRPAMAETPGGRWWRRVAGGLRKATGCTFEDLSEKLLLIEFHGYHSRKWLPLPVTLPSQRYGFALTRRAIERNAAIIVLRAGRPWQIAVPELLSYRRLIRTSSVQTSAVSNGNLRAPDFELVCRLLTEA